MLVIIRATIKGVFSYCFTSCASEHHFAFGSKLHTRSVCECCATFHQHFSLVLRFQAMCVLVEIFIFSYVMHQSDGFRKDRVVLLHRLTLIQTVQSVSGHSMCCNRLGSGGQLRAECIPCVHDIAVCISDTLCSYHTAALSANYGLPSATHRVGSALVASKYVCRENKYVCKENIQDPRCIVAPWPRKG
jgi:hypothetical protein